jgi:IclR family transcriptional regulator, KDG regulon repressor
MKKNSSKNKYPVKSVIKTLAIFQHLGASESGATLTEISTGLRIGKSTVHRLLATLRDHDFVWLDPISSRWILGARILQLSEQLNHQSILIRYGDPIVSRLARATGETCNLGVRDGTSVLYLVIKESGNPLRMTGQVGKRLPAHCTALGKALLTGLTRNEFGDLYSKTEKLEAFTSKSIRYISDLMRSVEKTKETGVAVDDGEIYTGVTCFAAPVRDQSGGVVAAISISFPKNRVKSRSINQFRSMLLEAAHDLSYKLGYREPILGRRVAE